MPATKFVIRNVEAVQNYIRSLPRGVVKIGLAAIAEYILGDSGHGLRHDDPYKYVSRQSAYGKTFSSDKQRRWFWANGGPDMIGKPRTGDTARAWYKKETNSGYGYTLQNDTAAAYYTRSDYGQAAQPAMVGWRKTSKVVEDNIKGAIRHAIAEVRKFLKNG